MNKYISEFLKGVCHEIKYTKIHNDISKELLGHIDEIKEEYISDGMLEDEATHKAVRQMGNPVEIGKDLNKTHKPRTEWSIVILTFLMVAVGAGVLFSMVLFSNGNKNVSPFSIEQFIKSYLIYALLGVVIFIICFFVDYAKLEKYSLYIFITTIVFIFAIRLNGGGVNNYSAWIVIGPLSMNSISITIPFFLISFSGLVVKWGTGNLKDTLKLLVLMAIAILMYLIQPSIVDAIILGCGFLVILTLALISASNNGKKALFLIYGTGIGGAVGSLFFMMKTSPYRLHNLSAFLNPGNDPEGRGYLYLFKKQALSGAKLLGKGQGFNIQDSFALPMVNSEFIFTYIVSNFGWIAGIALILILLVAVIRMFLATEKIHSTYGKYIAISIVTVFFLQIVIHLAMNLGLLPIVGISLPLISYGGTNFITNMALVGLLLGIYRRKDLIILEN